MELDGKRMQWRNIFLDQDTKGRRSMEAWKPRDGSFGKCAIEVLMTGEGKKATG